MAEPSKSSQTCQATLSIWSPQLVLNKTISKLDPTNNCSLDPTSYSSLDHRSHSSLDPNNNNTLDPTININLGPTSSSLASTNVRETEMVEDDMKFSKKVEAIRLKYQELRRK